MTTIDTLGGLIRAGIEHDALVSLLHEADVVATHLAGNPGPGCIRRAETAVIALWPALLAHLDTEESDVYPLLFPEEMRTAVDLLILDHERIRAAVASVRNWLDTMIRRDFDQPEPLVRALVTLVALVRAHQDKESFLYVRAMRTAGEDTGETFG